MIFKPFHFQVVKEFITLSYGPLRPEDVSMMNSLHICMVSAGGLYCIIKCFDEHSASNKMSA
jgi:hypothetical protein